MCVWVCVCLSVTALNVRVLTHAVTSLNHQFSTIPGKVFDEQILLNCFVWKLYTGISLCCRGHHSILGRPTAPLINSTCMLKIERPCVLFLALMLRNAALATEPRVYIYRRMLTRQRSAVFCECFFLLLYVYCRHSSVNRFISW